MQALKLSLLLAEQPLPVPLALTLSDLFVSVWCTSSTRGMRTGLRSPCHCTCTDLNGLSLVYDQQQQGHGQQPRAR